LAIKHRQGAQKMTHNNCSKIQ